MLTNAQIIRILIKNAGYQTLYEFSRKNNLVHNIVVYSFENNAFTAKTIAEYSKALGIDLTFYVNSKIGQKRFICDEKGEEE